MLPTPQTCPVPDCMYKTAANLPTYEMLYKNLTSTHAMATNKQQAAPVQAGGGAGGGPKLDKLPHPQIGEGASQSD